MQDTSTSKSKQDDVKKCDPSLLCDNCSYYPIIPVHGHFECPNCHIPTKCCEGMVLDE